MCRDVLRNENWVEVSNWMRSLYRGEWKYHISHRRNEIKSVMLLSIQGIISNFISEGFSYLSLLMLYNYGWHFMSFMRQIKTHVCHISCCSTTSNTFISSSSSLQQHNFNDDFKQEEENRWIQSRQLTFKPFSIAMQNDLSAIEAAGTISVQKK